MSSKTVSRGSVALALAASLSLASAAPGFAAPHHRSGEREAQAQTSLWSFVINLTRDFVAQAFGFDPSQQKSSSSAATNSDNSIGADPNGISIAIDPTGPVEVLPTSRGHQ